MLRLSRKIARALSVLAAVAVGSTALAANVVYTPPTVATDHWLPTSGSTALDNIIKDYFLVTGGICKAGNVGTIGGVAVAGPVVLVDGGNDIKGSATSVHYTTIICVSNANIGTIAVGDVIAIAKESSGGSLEGTINVAANTPLSFIDPHAATLTCAANQGAIGPGVPYPSAQTYTLLTGCTAALAATNVASYVPVAGWADETPQLWQGFGPRPVTAANIANLNTAPLVQNVFGIAVSLNLYRALQKMQGLTVTSDTLANMPTLSSTAISSLLTGNMTPWTALTDAAGKGVNTYTGGAPLPKDTTVWICKRGTSSGTSAWTDINFTGQRCSNSNLALSTATTTNANCGSLPAGLTPDDFGCGWAGVNIADTTFPGSGTSDATKCLSAHDFVDEYAIGYATTNAAFGDAGGTGGSTDNSGTPSGNNGAGARFRFIAIDGQLPNLTGVANGTYPYVQDDVLNTPKANVSNAPAKANIPALTTYITAAGTGFQNPALLRDFINASSQVAISGDADWFGGVLFDNLLSPVAANTTPTTTAQLTTTGNPVSTYTQDTTLTGINNCARPVAELNAQNISNP